MRKDYVLDAYTGKVEVYVFDAKRDTYRLTGLIDPFDPEMPEEARIALDVCARLGVRTPSATIDTPA